MIRRIAPTALPVMVLGPSGTGKELVARAIHAASPRASRTLVPVHCGAVPADLLESELFGHPRFRTANLRRIPQRCHHLARRYRMR